MGLMAPMPDSSAPRRLSTTLARNAVTFAPGPSASTTTRPSSTKRARLDEPPMSRPRKRPDFTGVPATGVPAKSPDFVGWAISPDFVGFSPGTRDLVQGPWLVWVHAARHRNAVRQQLAEH